MANTPNTAGTSPYISLPTLPSPLAKPPIQARRGVIYQRWVTPIEKNAHAPCNAHRNYLIDVPSPEGAEYVNDG
jgi:hypothetical protein